MCGLSGVAGTIDAPGKKVAQELLIFNIPRGPHSTGLGGVSRIPREGIKVCKAMGTPFGDTFGDVGLFGYKSFDKLMNHSNKVLIGHNRWATQGEIAIGNAHPFWFPKVMGAHNGTLDPKSWKNLIGHGHHGTDSECIFNNINEEGVEDTIAKLQGAWALSFYDVQADTINFIRNKERTLHYIFSKENKALYWSSDWEPLLYALARAKVDVGDNKVHLFPEDTLMSWKLPNPGQAFGEVTRKIVKGQEARPFHNSTNGATGTSHFNRNQNNNGCFNVQGMRYDTAKKEWVPDEKAQGGLPGLLMDKSVIETFSKEGNVTILGNTDKMSPERRSELVARVTKVREEKFKAQVMIPSDWWCKWANLSTKVYWDRTRYEWITFSYDIAKNEWSKMVTDDPPECMPFYKVNIEAGGNHLFAYKGKREKRQIFYKGFEGNLLSENRFDSLMKDGCINCQRHPQWGNIVRFLNHDTFLCEHCKEMPNVVSWMSACK
jgi:hypothetical protein